MKNPNKSGYSKENHRQYVQISAAEGQPSTFWLGDSGRYYRTIKEAEEDNEKNALNPADYEITKSFWAQNKKTILGCLAVATIVIALIWAYRAGVIVIHKHTGEIPVNTPA